MRPARIVTAVVIAVIAGSAVANITGLAPLPGGPLGPVFEPAPGEHQMTTGFDAGPFYTTADVRNDWPVSATLVAVTPIVRSDQGAVTVLGARPYDLDHPVIGRGDVNGVVMGLEREPQTAWAVTPPVAGTTIVPTGDEQHRGVAILVRVAPTGSGPVDLAGYTVDYTVGPFRFRATSVINSVLVCPAGSPTVGEECGAPAE